MSRKKTKRAELGMACVGLSGTKHREGTPFFPSPMHAGDSESGKGRHRGPQGVAAQAVESSGTRMQRAVPRVSLSGSPVCPRTYVVPVSRRDSALLACLTQHFPICWSSCPLPSGTPRTLSLVSRGKCSAALREGVAYRDSTVWH